MIRKNIVTLLCLVAIPTILQAQPIRVEMDDSRWALSGDAHMEEYLGYKSIRMRTGRAVLNAVTFKDGSVDFDMAVTPFRSFVYLQFRMRTDLDHEELYFRPHHPGAPDAIQYSPVYRGASNWQLYHQPGYTGATDFRQYTWMHVRMVIAGTRAAVFVDGSERPQMVIPRLALGDGSGYLAFRSFLPQNQPEGVFVANFANLVVRPGFVPYDFADTPAVPEPPDGLILEWLVSPAFNPPSLDIRELPMDMGSLQGWKLLKPDATGLLCLGREIEAQRGNGVWAVLARVVVHSDREQVKRLNLGFSDAVTVFLNRKPVFSGDDSYHFDNPRRQGLLALGQGAVYLPLKKGDNELVLAISESFGGWGLMAQFEDMKGITVSAR